MIAVRCSVMRRRHFFLCEHGSVYDVSAVPRPLPRCSKYNKHVLERICPRGYWKLGFVPVAWRCIFVSAKTQRKQRDLHRNSQWYLCHLKLLKFSDKAALALPQIGQTMLILLLQGLDLLRHLV